MHIIEQNRTTTRTWSMSLALLVSLGTLNSTIAGTFSADFNLIPLSGAKLHGDARVEGGILKLTSVSTNQHQGSLVIDALDAANPVASFSARFRLNMGAGTGGEGLSFNFAPDLPDGPFTEEGAGNGLTVVFDSFDNGGSDAPAIRLKYRGTLLSSARFNPRSGTNFVEVAINARSDGKIDVVYGGTVVHTNAFGYIPTSGRFGLAARTSENTDNHFLDDLTITTTTLSRPYIGAVAPTGEDAPPNAVVSIQIQDFQTAVDPATIHLSFDGQKIIHSASKSGTVTTITYAPPGLLSSDTAHQLGLVFADRSTPPVWTTNQYGFRVERYAVIPPNFAIPRASVVLTNLGFQIRTVQARANAGLETTVARAEAQLAGTLIDPATGKPFENEAKPSPNDDGTFSEETTINYEQEASPIGSFTNNERTIPGIPGRGGHTDGVAMEAIAYLEIPAGYHRFGVTSDEGFKVAIARDVRDVFAPVVGSFDGGRRAGETIFSFVTETNGFFPCRLVWFEGGGAASVEFYSVTSDNRKILINDRNDTNSIKAYRPTDALSQTPPYIQSISPRLGETGVSRKPTVNLVLKDAQSGATTNSIRLKLNGKQVDPVIAKSGGVTTVSFQVTELLEPESLNKLSFNYSDDATPPNTVTREWVFTTARAAVPTGHWDFDAGNLVATVGENLTYGDGAPGELAGLTQFGTTTSFGIPDIGGTPAFVLKYGRSPTPGPSHPGYIMRHGITPNGGGSKVNQWTLAMDVFFPDPQEGGFSSIIETEEVASGADLYFRWNSIAGPGTGGIGILGQYTGDGLTRMRIDRWHRVAIAVDLTASPPVIGKFIDGVRFQNQGLTPPQIDGQYSLAATARLFSDDDNEVNTFYVNSIQVLDGKLTEDEIAALGGPTAGGIPLPSSRVSLAISRTGSGFDINWPAGVTGFVLERSDALLNPIWTAVAGVTNNSVYVPIKGESQFFRLRR